VRAGATNVGYRSDIEALRGSTVTDAPTDGKEYARKDGEWVEVVPNYTIKYDQDADPPTVAYLGKANPGTTTSQALWQIQKLTFSVDGDVSTQWADGDASFNNVWDNRASLSYS
jgi:hypothetical protein